MIEKYFDKKIYCISDLHSNYMSFNGLLSKIGFYEDKDIIVYILGDIFDRGNRPGEVFNLIQKNYNRIKVVKGNHDVWVAREIQYRISGVYKEFISYNTFNILAGEMSEAELLKVADWINSLPSQLEVCVNEKRCLLAHARCFASFSLKEEEYYLNEPDFAYYKEGIEGYDLVVSGHIPTNRLKFYFGIEQNNKDKLEVLFNKKCNCAFIDTGNGFASEDEIYRISALCLNDNSVIYY